MRSGPSTGGRGPEAPRAAAAGPIPLALYIHIPWCLRKCPYCDFNSHVAQGAADQDGYVDALLRDLDHEAARGSLAGIDSIFIGGGTPSLFEGAAIGRLLEGVARRVTLASDAEITLEANPGTAEARRFADYRAAGVNRLSIGVQSLDDARLQALGRIHSAAEALHAYGLARAAGFDNINLDLMYGLPGQSTAQAVADLEGLVSLGPEHISWYQLTLEPNTLFHHRPPALPDDDALAEIMDEGQALLADAGFEQYEISAYARTGHQCCHNLNYWRFGDYLGIGAGAHGKLSLPAGILRRSKLRSPGDYLARAAAGAVQAERRIDATELPVEFLLNALRLNAGVPAALFAARTGLPPETLAGPLERARQLGLMTTDPARLCATGRGLRFLNDLLALFEPD